MDRRYYRSTARSSRHGIEVSLAGLTEVYVGGLRKSHPWSELRSVKWLSHGRAVAVVGAAEIPLAGYEDLPDLVRQIESYASYWYRKRARLSHAGRLARRWRHEQARGRGPRLQRWASKMAGAAILLLPVLSFTTGGVWGTQAICLLLLAALALAVLPREFPPPPCVDERGIQAVVGRWVGWAEIRGWEERPGPEHGTTQFALDTSQGASLTVPFPDERLAAIRRLLGVAVTLDPASFQPAGPEPAPDTALSLARDTGEHAGGRGLSVTPGPSGL